jgi:hypothetical protein
MARFILAAICVTLAAPPFHAKADWCSTWRYVCQRDYKRNNCWPQPFVQPSREVTKLPFYSMIDNGWKRQNLIGDHYFDPDTQKLTPAGELKARWIVTQLPLPRRALFVQRGRTVDQTLARVDAVRAAVEAAVPAGEMPPIWETNLEPVGSPADYLERVDSSYLETMPDPRLPEQDKVETGL